jgi:protein-tyrosine phosphatase
MLKRQRQARNARQGISFESPASGTLSEAQGDSFFPQDVNNDEDWTLRDDRDLIEQTVEDFRLQRLSMVQSLRQFVLCYESVLEWLVEQHPKSA